MFKGNNKFILHIVQKNKRNDRRDTNSNSKTNSGLSFNQEEKSEQQHVQGDKDESMSCFKCKTPGYISPHCIEITKEDGSPLNTKEQAIHFKTRSFLQDRSM